MKVYIPCCLAEIFLIFNVLEFCPNAISFWFVSFHVNIISLASALNDGVIVAVPPSSTITVEWLNRKDAAEKSKNKYVCCFHCNVFIWFRKVNVFCSLCFFFSFMFFRKWITTRRLVCAWFSFGLYREKWIIHGFHWDGFCNKSRMKLKFLSKQWCTLHWRIACM